MSWRNGGPWGAAPLVVGLTSIAVMVACSAGPGQSDGDAQQDAPDGRARATTDGLPRPAPPPSGGVTRLQLDGRSFTPRSGASPRGEETGAQQLASRYVTGLGMAALGDVMTRYGVACDRPAGEPGDVQWSCSGADAAHDVEYSVSIDGADENRIRHVTGLVTQFGVPDVEVAAAFLGDVASLDYRGADPARARDWVRAWLNGAAARDEVTMGDAALVLQGTLESCSLDLVASELAAP